MLYTDALVSTTYDASVAGLSWGLAPSADGIKLTVSGYSDKLLLLLQKVRAGCTPRVHAGDRGVSTVSGSSDKLLLLLQKVPRRACVPVARLECMRG